ncbi:MAG: hypothetical protein U0Z44_08395 [Kouleothrix sp.]
MRLATPTCCWRWCARKAGCRIARDDETAYTFPHLTFKEHLAACWLADQAELLEQAYPRWQGADRERWRQVLLLLAGRLRRTRARRMWSAMACRGWMC